MRHIVRFQFLLVVMFLLAGCTHPGKIRGSDLIEIQLGMSKGDVIEKLGKPANASANENFEVYRYFEDLGMYRRSYHDFVFIDGKLKLFGPSENPNFRAKLEVITSQH